MHILAISPHPNFNLTLYTGPRGILEDKYGHMLKYVHLQYVTGYVPVDHDRTLSRSFSILTADSWPCLSCSSAVVLSWWILVLFSTRSIRASSSPSLLCVQIPHSNTGHIPQSHITELARVHCKGFSSKLSIVYSPTSTTNIESPN